jgi:thioredoxin 1
MAVTVTDATFQADVRESTKPVIVDLWAPWCQPCKLIERELAEVERQFGDRVTIAKVNIDENPALVRSLEIRSIPTLLFYASADASPISIVGGSTSKQIISRFRLSELSS